MRRTVIVSVTAGALIASQAVLGGVAQAQPASSLLDKVNALQSSESVRALAENPGTVYSVTAASAESSVVAGGATTLSASVLVPMTQSSTGATVAFQQLTDIGQGMIGWKTQAVAITTPGEKSATSNFGTATAQAPVGNSSPAQYRAVATYSPPATWPTDGSIPQGAVVSSLLMITVTPATPAPATTVSATWPGLGSLQSNQQVNVAVTSNGGAGLPVSIEYSANGQSWHDVGLPLAADVYSVAARPTTDAQGRATAALIAPTSPGNYQFRARVGAVASAATGQYVVTEIDYLSLYNPPAYGSTPGANYMPQVPGQLIKAQQLDTNASNINNRPPQYPANPTNNPINGSPGFVVPQVLGAGSPACMFRTNTLEDCYVGNTVSAGVDTYRIMYSTQRFTLKPPPQNPDGSYGTYDTNDPESLGSTKIPDGTSQAPIEAASGLVLKPRNAAADAQVVVWTHPTIGQTNHCSVSRGFTTFSAPLAAEPQSPSTSLNEGDMSFFLEQMLSAGKIVVLPDYLGIGVNGPTNTKKTYLVGQQEARDVFYAVQSLRTNPAEVPGWDGIAGGEAMTNSDFVTIGHSQGGHAALWTGVGSQHPWAQSLGLNLKGVVAVAPATDIAMISKINWQGIGGWVLGPQLIQTYLNMSEDFTKFALNNNVTSPEGFAALPVFQDYCAVQSITAATPYLANGQNFFIDPATAPGAYDNWEKVFSQQSPIIEPGKMNSFPQQLPMLMISGTADNVVIAQLQAAMQQEFCAVDPVDGNPKAENFRAYWTPTLSGMLTPAAMGFKGTIAGDVLTVSEVTAGAGRPLQKPLLARQSATVYQLGNLFNIRVGDALTKVNSNAAPAGIVITAIDYATNTVTFNQSPGIAAVGPNDTLTVQPGNSGLLAPGVEVVYAQGTATASQSKVVTIAAPISGVGGVGTYRLTEPASQDVTSAAAMSVEPKTTLGQASPASMLQSANHANPILFPFTTAEYDVKVNVTNVNITHSGLAYLQPRDITLTLSEMPAQFVPGATVNIAGMPTLQTNPLATTKAGVNGPFVLTATNREAKTITFRGSNNLNNVSNLQPENAVATSAYKYNNSASEAISFMSDALAGNPIKENCAQVNEQRMTGLNSGATGQSWYSTPVMLDTLSMPDPTKADFYMSWGSPALPAPNATNDSPAIGLLLMDLDRGTAAEYNCGLVWQPLLKYGERPANEACQPFGLYPYGEDKNGTWDPNFVYDTVNVSNGYWGKYPNDGANDSQWVNTPVQGSAATPLPEPVVTPEPDPQPVVDEPSTGPTAAPEPAGSPTGSTFVGITPVRAYDSRTAEESKLAGLSTRNISVAEQVPPGASAVAYNVTATNQEAAGWLSVQPGDIQEVGTSALNWTVGDGAIANGLVSKLDTRGSLNIHNGSPNATDVVVDVVGYYLPVVEGQTVSGSLFHASQPSRIYDSRTAADGGPAPLKPGLDNALVLKVANLPAGTTAIAYNLTVIDGQQNGWLSVLPGDATEVQASTLNWKAGTQSLANGQIVTVDQLDQIKVVNGIGAPVHIAIDFAGYFVDVAQDDGTGQHFYPVNPKRAMDSRLNAQPGLPGLTQQIVDLSVGRNLGSGDISTREVIPAASSAAIVNLTVVADAPQGWLAVRPSSALGTPSTSTVNWSRPGAIVANGVSTSVTEQQVSVYAGGTTGNANFVVDVFGYYE